MKHLKLLHRQNIYYSVKHFFVTALLYLIKNQPVTNEIMLNKQRLHPCWRSDDNAVGLYARRLQLVPQIVLLVTHDLN